MRVICKTYFSLFINTFIMSSRTVLGSGAKVPSTRKNSFNLELNQFWVNSKTKNDNEHTENHLAVILRV